MSEIVYMPKEKWKNLLDKIREKNIATGEMTVVGATDAIGSIENGVDYILLMSTNDLETYSNANLVQIARNQFGYQYSLREINIPNVTSIGHSAFYDCSQLCDVTVADNCSLNHYAFYECYNLDITKLAKVKTIGDYAFCLSNVYKLAQYLPKIDVEFPNVLEVGSYAFKDNIRINNVSFPNATAIGPYAFSLSTSSKAYGRLASISMPKVTNVGAFAFYYQSDITDIDLTGVEYIFQSAFYGCEKLKKVDTGAQIDANAFYGCKGLETFKYRGKQIGSGVYSSRCFGECSSLKNVWISKTCTSINGGSASYAPFYNCTALTDIYVEADSAPEGWTQYWDSITSSTKATVHYGVTEEQFDEIVGGV